MKIKTFIPDAVEVEVNVCLTDVIDAMLEDINSETADGTTTTVNMLLNSLGLIPDKAIANLKDSIRLILHNAILDEAKRWDSKTFCATVET